MFRFCAGMVQGFALLGRHGLRSDDVVGEWDGVIMPPGRTAATGSLLTSGGAAVVAPGSGSRQPGAYAPDRGRDTGGQAELAQDVGQVPVHGVLAQG